MKAPSLRTRLKAYLSLREALGMPIQSKSILEKFVRYLERNCHGEAIRTCIVLDWVYSDAEGIPAQYARFCLARSFLIYLRASLPDTEIPDTNLIATPRRSKPYVFSDHELIDLLREAGQLDSDSTLYPYSLQILLGLMSCTGLRPGEARNLTISDLDLDGATPRLLIRCAKFHKTRWVPLHESAADQLRHYLRWRLNINKARSSQFLFVTKRVQAINRNLLWRTVRDLVNRLEIRPRPGQLRPTPHSLRHTFAVHRLSRWYEEEADVRGLLPGLSIYLGHSNPAASYWYLSETPELMNAASMRFEDYIEKGKAS